ncbi:4-methyl-5(b-hydroxyethyl)-thiazole monophosphate biosynthesis [Andreprevotia lacus DSM 23236]|uniref:4-methyl-5(B-hydroxyethyl)-thiazole monophosphate biosynthesis n=1 Tax=Andreprevotia lacus DSM 23236 TaxID=1121001 RepID=A0A1W1XDR0_9NEIS|nr:DJ-1 family glyoxalase III [Andreprevotia lacus]SMC22175.1 4-methyl-5(b-hydroxyethyl)-thiazole monophosphate biosynthesis [Andreprevotia lacus DSM 23236]
MPTVHVYIAPGFEEVELITIVDVLRRAGIETTLVALDEQLAVRGAHDIVVQADAGFAAVAELQADAIVLPGGGPGTQALGDCLPLHERLRAQAAAGRRVAAICAAPTVLAKAGVLQGREATCFPGLEQVLAEHGAKVSNYQVVTDDIVTTSRGPATAGLFGIELARLLVGHDKALAVGRAMLFL